MKKEDELLKCCGRYPSVGWKVVEGKPTLSLRFYCPICGKTTPYYMSAGKSANIEWNKMVKESEER